MSHFGLILDAAAGTTSAFGQYGTTIIMIVVLVVVFYFFLIRPENKKKKKLADMRSSLSVGDDITTIGGIVGKVVACNNETVTFETGEDRVRVQVAKWAISTVGKATQEQPK
ncbi:preprotein translocase subunit YajC [Sporobacter termitidis DSM 10068]|uniref:Preprotein translocase subunit YajC n=1 Tax=Sporobacter termitidis DSM 10068 TaxID=1123282 RepID=A0A1M5TFC7_9FIRM|nr:preprotein translocase subunit YajC [Sporobacter termitidis]SHH49371.1 preprotein translocase subunit YajC [Sporobacter termitidis DSM 10068]